MSRGAPRVVATSDVTRFRGVAVAAVVAAATATVLVVRWSPSTRGGAPGPLSASHRAANVTCGGCHTAGLDAAPPAAACVTCHGAHPSRRSGHAALRANGVMTCATCHGGHRGHGSVTFFPDGRARRDDPAGARELAGGAPANGSPDTSILAGFRPPRPVTVPLVEVAACSRCHDAQRSPLASCAIGGAGGVSGCFDEHTAIRGVDGAIVGRDLAWDAAREIARAMPPRPAPSRTRDGGPWWWLGAAGIAALLAAVIARRASRPATNAATSAGRRPPSPAINGATIAAPTGATSPNGESPPSAAPPRAPSHAAAPTAPAMRRLPIINAATCLGCDACVEACPYDVLEVRRYVAVVARPDACCGLTLCAQVCPNESLTMHDAGPADAPALARIDLEAAAHPGIFVVGDAGGGSLIRNAIDEGARAVAAIAARLAHAPRNRAPHDDAAILDVLIIGAGPAGLSAALEAQARGLRALTVEQHTVAGSIQSFPRGKLVLDAAPAAAAAATARLWLAEATKEELLARWTLAVRTHRPAILEGRRVIGLHDNPDGTWTVDLADDDPRRARALVLAVGRRGSPRRLAADVDIAPGMLPHVHYALADAASFAGRRVVIVGLGDVAIETAIALSRQPGTTVTIAHRGDAFRRGRTRNLDELRRRVAAGAVRIAWRAEIRAVAPGRVALATPTGPVDEPCDSLFVLIGAEPGADLLSRLTPPVQPAQTDAAHHAFGPVGPVQRPGDRGEEAPP